MKSVLLLGQIMFYLRIFNFQAQLGTRDIQKFDFKKVLFTSKKLKFMILDRLQKQPTIPYRGKWVLAKYQPYYLSLCRLVNEGGGGSKILKTLST